MHSRNFLSFTSYHHVTTANHHPRRESDCWVVVHNKVYNITKFLPEVRLEYVCSEVTRFVVIFSLSAPWRL